MAGVGIAFAPDLRGFTALADRDDPLEVVGWLDEHFDALGEPVQRRGGEISKFLGDGFLAVFPVDAPDAVARRCAAPLVPVGEFALRGVGPRQRIWGLPLGWAAESGVPEPAQGAAGEIGSE